MQKSIILFLLAFISTFVLPFTPIGQAAELPPELSEIAEELNDCEEAFRSGDFTNALENLEKINGLYARIVPQLMQVVDSEQVTNFPAASESFKAALQSGDKELSERSFRNLTHLIFEYIGKFEVEGSSQLAFILRQIKEAAEKLEQGNLEDFEDELEEIGEYLIGAKDKLLEQGISSKSFDEINQAVHKIGSLLEDKAGAEALTESVKQTEALITGIQNELK